MHHGGLQASRRRILLYEFTSSGGLLGDHGIQVPSLSREGWAMLRALATDLTAIPGVQLQVLVDHRGLPSSLPNCELIAVDNAARERALLSELSIRADWTIVIAPETEGTLLDRCRAVEASGGRLLGPSSALVVLLGDKHRTAQHLSANRIACPNGTNWRPNTFNVRLSCPLVVKPLDGAGAQDTYLLHDQSAVDELLVTLTQRRGPKRAWRIETFESGIAVSVSALCGPGGGFVLPPCFQRVKCDTAISYEGGAYPLPPSLADRAANLARRTLKTIPSALGYIGIDMVLGDNPDGRSDLVIEINPRLTTSYVGLRAAARSNLAEAMLDVAEGRHANLSFNRDPLEFDPDGAIRMVKSTA